MNFVFLLMMAAVIFFFKKYLFMALKKLRNTSFAFLVNPFYTLKQKIIGNIKTHAKFYIFLKNKSSQVDELAVKIVGFFKPSGKKSSK